MDHKRMDYKKISMEDYPRKDHFAYFSKLAYPYMGTTVEVDITEWLAAVHSQCLPFFHSFLYAVSNAGNCVPQLRQRILDGGIIEFEQCLSSYTVALPDETYCYCTLDTRRPFSEFPAYAEREQQKAIANANISDGEDGLSLFFISTLPWFHYSALVQPVPYPADSNPRITWGKYATKGDRVFLPVSILCHHALVEGLHLHHFYEQLNAQLASMAKLSIRFP